MVIIRRYYLQETSSMYVKGKEREGKEGGWMLQGWMDGALSQLFYFII